MSEKYWNASPSKEDPDSFWEDDDTGEYVDARTNERMTAAEGRKRISKEKRNAKN